jgi:hypothetical protein
MGGRQRLLYLHQIRQSEKAHLAVSSTQPQIVTAGSDPLRRWRPPAWHYKDAAAVAGLPF